MNCVSAEQCVCGHMLDDHTKPCDEYRDHDVFGPCTVDGCDCEDFTMEEDTSMEGMG